MRKVSSDGDFAREKKCAKFYKNSLSVNNMCEENS